MKILQLLLIGLGLIALPALAQENCPPPPPGAQYCPCPQPPPGNCPYIEAFALTDIYTMPVAFIETPVPGFNGKPLVSAIRLEFEQQKDAEYEIQFTRSLDFPVWIAYARWKASKHDLVMTDCPVYPCDTRYFRVMTKPHSKLWRGNVTPQP